MTPILFAAAAILLAAVVAAVATRRRRVAQATRQPVPVAAPPPNGPSGTGPTGTRRVGVLVPAARVAAPANALAGAAPSWNGGFATKAGTAEPDSRTAPPIKQGFDPLWRLPESTEPDLAERLGGGAQGDVHAIEGDPSRVFKKLSVPAAGARAEFDRLVGKGPSMRSSLEGTSVELVWPMHAVADGDSVTGYVMPRLPADYVVRVAGNERESQLMYAVPKEGPFRPDVIPDAYQRLALITGVARFLNELHKHDYVYGDISWSNILFRLHPSPTVLVFDVDGVRGVGRRPILAATALDTIDFVDHASDSGHDAGFDSDRYKFALLAHRMLISLKLSGPLPDRVDVPADLGLSSIQVLRLERLFRRAAGAAGTRPTLAEWLDVLTTQRTEPRSALSGT